MTSASRILVAQRRKMILFAGNIIRSFNAFSSSLNPKPQSFFYGVTSNKAFRFLYEARCHSGAVPAYRAMQNLESRSIQESILIGKKSLRS